MLNKKGAMFGLDARIALAIFGALSVISGAALYSAIQNSKAISLLTQMQEVEKGYEQYYLDTGQELEYFTGGTGYHNYRKLAGNLISSSVDNWKGPYINFESSSSITIDLPGFASHAKIYIIVTSDLEWGEGYVTAPTWYDSDVLCSSSIQCYTWVLFTGVDKNLHSLIDDSVDGQDGASKGNYRWYKPATTYTYALKIMPTEIF